MGSEKRGALENSGCFLFFSVRKMPRGCGFFDNNERMIKSTTMTFSGSKEIKKIKIGKISNTRHGKGANRENTIKFLTKQTSNLIYRR